MRLPDTIVLTALLCAAPALAQEDPTKPPSEVQKFAPLIGSWEGSGTVAEGPGAERMEWTSHSTCRWALGGQFVREDVEIDLGDMGTLAFRNFYGWDRENERYFVLEVSNFGRAKLHPIHWVDDDTMVYASSGVDMGQYAVERWTSKIDGDTIEMRGDSAMGAGDFYVHVEGTSKRTSEKPSEAKTVNAAFMPDSNTTPAKMKSLEGLAGTYRMKGWMIPPGMPQKVDISATEKLGWMFGGTVLEMTLDADPVPAMGNMEYAAWGCWAWDDQADCLKSFWLSNTGEVGVDDVHRVGDELVITSGGTYQGQPRAMRAVIQLDESGAISEYDATAMVGTGEPVHNFHGTYEKKN